MSSPERSVPAPAPTATPAAAPAPSTTPATTPSTTPATSPATSPPPAPAERVLQLMMGAWVSQTTFVLAKLGIPDVLAERPRTAHEVAQAIGTHPDGTASLLRAAGTIGLLTESADGCVQLTDMGHCLRSDTPDSMREQALAFGTPTKWQLAGSLGRAVSTGESPAPEILGGSLWDHFNSHPEEALHFSRAMGEQSARAADDVAAVVDATQYAKIVDVGGAHGVLLAAVLDKAPGTRGVLFDQPSVIEQARQELAETRLASRVELVGGDFFDNVPTGDLYLLKWILHDWDDERAHQILATLRRAAPPGARLLVVEMLLPDPWAPSPVHLFDLTMLTLLGSRERTQKEYEALLTGAGWELEKVIPTSGLYNVLQAVAVADKDARSA